MDEHGRYNVDAELAARYPNKYVAPAKPVEDRPEPVSETVWKMRGSDKRRQERDQAILDADGWIAWMIGYRAELVGALRLSSLRQAEAPRKASLVRGRPARRDH